MSLFGFGEKNKKQEISTCGCNCGCSASETKKDVCCEKNKNGICCIKVLGAGCKSCQAQYENTKEAIKNMGIDIEVEYITDMKKVMKYGVMSMPALVVNEKVVSVGKVLKVTEVEKILCQFSK